jgi:hypothetical protein
MLRNGAPIRQFQEMLGHASLETTRIYTRVSINDPRDAQQVPPARAGNRTVTIWCALVRNGVFWCHVNRRETRASKRQPSGPYRKPR